MKDHAFSASPPNLSSRPYRPWIFRLARALLFIGFFLLVLSSSLASTEQLGPGLWWLLIASGCVFTALWLSRLSVPAPLTPITEIPMKHYGWFTFFIFASPFVLRWFNWDGPQLVGLVALATLLGAWASCYPIARRQVICAQYDQSHWGSEP